MKRKKKTAAAPAREQEKLDKWHLLGTKAMDRWGWFAPSTKKQQYEMVSVAVYWMFQLPKKILNIFPILFEILRYIQALCIFFFFLAELWPSARTPTSYPKNKDVTRNDQSCFFHPWKLFCDLMDKLVKEELVQKGTIFLS